nr:histone H2B.V2-like [Ipomoea batatas]
MPSTEPNKNKSFSNNQGSPSFAQNQSVNPKKEGNPNLDEIQCYECKGCGHIQSECPNYLRRKNKTYVTTLSDDSDSEEENNTNFVAFFTIHEDDDESKEDMQDLLNSYTQLHAKWEEIIKVNLNLMQENHFLKSEKEKEILLHKETQEKLMKSLEEGDKLLQEIRRLTESVVQPDLATRKDSAVENREVLQHHFQHRRRIRCYYCHRLGHIKAYCYKRQNDLHNRIWAKQEQKPAQKVWDKITSGSIPQTSYSSEYSLDPIHAAVENYVSNPSTDNKEDDIPNSLNKCNVKWRLNFNIVADDEGTTQSSFPKENPPDVHAAKAEEQRLTIPVYPH